MHHRAQTFNLSFVSFLISLFNFSIKTLIAPPRLLTFSMYRFMHSFVCNFAVKGVREQCQIHHITSHQKTCEERGLKINGAKTQLLAISANQDPTGVWIEESG